MTLGSSGHIQFEVGSAYSAELHLMLGGYFPVKLVAAPRKLCYLAETL